MGEWFLRLAEKDPKTARLIVVCALLAVIAICVMITVDQVHMWSS